MTDRLRSASIDAMRSTGIGKRLNDRVPGKMIDDGDAGIRAAFERRERVAAAGRRPLVTADGRNLAGRAERDQLVRKCFGVDHRELRRRRGEADSEQLLVGRQPERIGQPEREHVLVRLIDEIDDR